MEEKWKTIEGYPNYQISSLGRVKSLNYNRTGIEKILKPIKNKNGYMKVSLCKKGKQKCITIHRLVCKEFLPNPENLPQINHRNEDKSDNRVENLEYCDAKYNNNYGSRNERITKTKTNNIKCSKKVKCIETGITYPSIMEVQRQLGFANTNISSCCAGKLKSAYKLHWSYVD